MTDSEQVTFGGIGVAEDKEDSNRDRLVDNLGRICDDELPDMAQTGDWPVRFDHCFRRLVYDAACDDEWYDHVDGDSFVDDAETEQLVRALEHAARLLYDKESYAWQLQEMSLLWRGEMDADEAEHVDPEVVLC